MRATIALSLVALLFVGYLIPKFTIESDKQLSAEEVRACRYISRVYIFNHPLDRFVIAHQTVHSMGGEAYLVKTYFPFSVPYENIAINLGKTFNEAKAEVESYNLENQKHIDKRWACDGSTRSLGL